ncbi:hypothetical protein RSJ21_00160 (plasmid) [Clostridium botulinum]|uniref:hypothetical protein n=1 Tax=Clostridium botulinum TaxID=1491 RepID=UPI000C791E88|nr:hypothetical protein [Clostridium botulinum]AUN23751.1 hypothetical protein RSJ21_00160 [Clostridium botulinum]
MCYCNCSFEEATGECKIKNFTGALKQLPHCPCFIGGNIEDTQEEGTYKKLCNTGEIAVLQAEIESNYC